MPTGICTHTHHTCTHTMMESGEYRYHTSTFLINLICPTYSVDENQQHDCKMNLQDSEDLERKAILTLALLFQHCSFNILAFASIFQPHCLSVDQLEVSKKDFGLFFSVSIDCGTSSYFHSPDCSPPPNLCVCAWVVRKASLQTYRH